jgi:hypothetical protein
MKKQNALSTRLFLEGQEVDLLDDISITANYEIASVKDISKKSSAYSNTITLPGSQNNNRLFNYFFDVKSTGTYFVAPATWTAAISNKIPGLVVMSVNLDGNTFNTTDGSTLVTPITNGNSQTSLHNEIDFTNWSVTVSGNTSGTIVYKVNGTIIQTNRVTADVNTYLFPANQYLYQDVLEIDFQTADQSFTGNIGYNLDFKKKMKAYVLQDGQIVLSGYAKIVNATNTDGQIEYQIQITSELGALNALLANQRLQDLYTITDNSGQILDLNSPYDHQLLISNITGSWSGEMPYVYPLIEYGDQDSTSNFTTWYTQNFRPCLYAKDYWDEIFASVGYTYSSAFLNSDYFESLIIPFHEGNFTLIDQYDVDATCDTGEQFTMPAYLSSVEAPAPYSSGITSATFANVDSNDPYEIYNASLGTYNPEEQGTYVISSQFTFNFTFEPVDSGIQLQNPLIGIFVTANVYDSTHPIGGAPLQSIELWETELITGAVTFDGTPYFEGATVISDDLTVNFYGIPIQLTAADQYIDIEISCVAVINEAEPSELFPYYGGGGYSDGFIYCNIQRDTPGDLPQIAISRSPVLDGQFIRFKDFVPKNIKQIDYLSSIIRLFNLYLEPDTNIPKHFNIYTRDEYFANTNTLDWTNKLDNLSPVTVKPIPELDANQLQFTYVKDDDFYNSLYEAQYNGYTYGELRLDTGYEFAPGIKNVMKGIIFAPTIPVQSSNDFFPSEGPIEIMNTPFIDPVENSSNNVIQASGYYAVNGHRSGQAGAPPIINNFSGIKFTRAKVGVQIEYWGNIYTITQVFNDYSFQVDRTLIRPIIPPLTTNQVNGTYYATYDGFTYLTNSNVIVPVIAETPDNGITFKPHKCKPRILHFSEITGGNNECNPITIQYTPYIYNGTYYYFQEGSMSGTTSSGAVTYEEYPFCSHLDDPVTPTKDLLFAQPDETFFALPAAYPSKNLFTRYWLNTVNEITDEDAKFVDCKLKLRSIDMSNLDLSNVIAINGTNYRINSIKDYAVDNSLTTQTELIRLPLYQFTTDPATMTLSYEGSLDVACNNFTLISTAALDNDGVEIVQYLWTQVEGPSDAVIAAPYSPSTTVSNLAVGTYVFNLYVLTNYGLTSNTQISVPVSAHTAAPTVTASNNGPITLPSSTFELLGTAEGNSCATIEETLWTQISGGTSTILSPNALNSYVDGVTSAGEYLYKLTAVDNYGISGSTTTTVTVYPAPTVTIQNFVNGNTLNVSGINALTQQGSQGLPIVGDGTFYGTYSSFTGAISIDITGPTLPINTLYAVLFKNGESVSCIDINATGSYSFSSETFNGTDTISIIFTTGQCSGTSTSTSSTTTTSTTTTSTTTTSSTTTSSTTTTTTTTTTTAAPTVVVQNVVNSLNITSVTGISGLTPSFTAIDGDGSYHGYHSAFTGGISVTLTGTVPSGGGETYSIRLFKNGTQIGCQNVTATGTFSFSSATFASTDVINIQMTTGSC